jgi:hypothetical protein
VPVSGNSFCFHQLGKNGLLPTAMRLQLYGRDSSFCIPNYSVVGNLLFDIVAQTPARELAAWEKLFVVRSIGLPVHAGYLADVYMACGCFSEARQTYLKPEHPRKLGDICWCEGDLEQAESYYSRKKSDAQSYKAGPDDDRLIKLAFFQEQWDKVVARFLQGSFGKWNPPDEVSLGNSIIKAGPYLDMLAVAVRRSGMPIPPRALAVLETAFGLPQKQWEAFCLMPVYADGRTLAKLKARCRPRLGAAQVLSLGEALRKGDTARARHVVAYIRQADQHLESAQRALEKFAKTGEDGQLEQFISLVTDSGVSSICHSFLFSALGHDSFPGRDDVPADRLIRLFSCHSVMDKRHLGELLDLRFKHRLPLSASDVLIGIFQMLGRPNLSVVSKGLPEKVTLDIPRLASCREWARIRLEEWLRMYGNEGADKVAETWRDGKAVPAAHPFYAGVIGVPESPRNMTEWNALMAEAREWLERRWKLEIGSSPWVTENQLYQILRRLLHGMEVVQHARPTWLEPQHLDIYVPQADVGIEYMGQQHFEPLEFFGGQAAFQQLVERDQKKAELCRLHGLELIRVRFDEDVGARAKEIAQRISGSSAMVRRFEAEDLRPAVSRPE